MFFRWVIIIILVTQRIISIRDVREKQIICNAQQNLVFSLVNLFLVLKIKCCKRVKYTKSKYYYKTLYGATWIVGSISKSHQNAHFPIL